MKMDIILLAIYVIAGYWATGQTIFKDKIVIEFEFGALFMKRFFLGVLLGWILIPIAVIRKIFHFYLFC
jgi:hypothetical protein